MGRFGVGLPQSSLYACPEVEVFSWQSGVDSVQKVFLNIEKVKEGIQKEIEDPIAEALPEKYIKYISYITPGRTYDFSKSGTLVIWKHCDRIQPKTCGPLSERLEFALGQKFRYFISKGISSIRIIRMKTKRVLLTYARMTHFSLWKIILFLAIPHTLQN